MRIFILTTAALVLSATQAPCADWGPVETGDATVVAAGYTHDDGGSLIVLCSTDQRLIRIVHIEPRARWNKGDTVNETTMDDDGIGTTSKYGKAASGTSMIVANESTFDLLRMGQAKRFFTVTIGNYARIYPTANFKRATEPVMKACGDKWQ